MLHARFLLQLASQWRCVDSDGGSAERALKISERTICEVSSGIHAMSGPAEGEGLGGLQPPPPHFFGNFKVLLRKRCFQHPPPPPHFTFKVAPRALHVLAVGNHNHFRDSDNQILLNGDVLLSGSRTNLIGTLK